MQRVEQGTSDKVRGPNHGRGRDEEATSNTTDGETNLLRGEETATCQIGRSGMWICETWTHKLRGHGDHPLVAERVNLVVVYALHSDDIRLRSRSCQINGDITRTACAANEEGALTA